MRRLTTRRSGRNAYQATTAPTAAIKIAIFIHVFISVSPSFQFRLHVLPSSLDLAQVQSSGLHAPLPSSVLVVPSHQHARSCCLASNAPNHLQKRRKKPSFFYSCRNIFS